jgi:glutamate synthase (NADPH) large chain
MAEPQHYPTGLPSRQGLYDPANEHDACGIGFIVNVKGVASHEIVQQGLEILDHLSHRAAVGCDPCSGDGAGILFQLPDAFFRGVCSEQGIELPAAGEYGVGMLFLPQDEAERERCQSVIEGIVAEEGLEVLGWRDVPNDPAQVGPLARQSVPVIRQLLVGRGSTPVEAIERRLYLTRRRVEKAIEEILPGGESFYVVSLSSRTIVYKGLLIPFQIPLFYPDLVDERVASALALVHSRFSTNTFPTWPRAHPYRLVCHNGEINTLQGNVNWMRVREGRVGTELFGEEIEKLFPIIAPHGSDSACFDNALEFLMMGGRSLPHAMMMMIPEAWAGHDEMDPDRRSFYEYHASLMEPWDGPAAVAFTDGRYIGATLDRNGLRPARYLVTEDDLVILASEAGTLPVQPDRVRSKGRLQPGRMFLVDTLEGRIIDDEEIKADYATRQPYREWVAANEVRLHQLPEPASLADEPTKLQDRQAAFGYTIEELNMILAPMASTGEEPVGSMGTDTPLAVLSERPQLLFKYFKQLFAQVTNPPIDPIREELVMSLAVLLGPHHNVLSETPEHARKIYLPQPILTSRDLAKIRGFDGYFEAHTIRALFPAAEGPAGLAPALERVCLEAEQAIRDGATLLVLSDRGVDEDWAPIPSLLITGAVHHHLIRTRLRTAADLIIETGEAREVPHFALLLGYGAAAVNPYLAFETLDALGREGALGESYDPDKAEAKYIKAIGKGLLKIFSKMGISTLQSYCGAQIFEALGLDEAFADRFFSGTPSRIGGIGTETVAEETLRRHAEAFQHRLPLKRLDFGGEYHYRIQGERHGWSPLAIATLQQATRQGSISTFREFSQIANEQAQTGLTLRGLVDFTADRQPIPIEEVEPVTEIVRRFSTGAMSFGSISAEAHETLAIAMNRLGGKSNTGEGGEDPDRFIDERNSAIKQVASGRFGVTTEYLVNARQLQIKMAQGAKPGEGGQLPGHKVDETIAKTRYSTPGVSLISPPPHHDIYSIEDLAQLIADLKTVNPAADISVKLVAEVGVGTVAAGVAKAHADHIVISGDSGGTGASPLSSIKHAGIPWELGLAETQQTLVLNDLRGRVRLQTDGQLKTGRDVMVAALLGADEFGFATAPLVVEGCIMMRKCHLNTCPVGIATQDPELRKKFTGQPEHVINYFFFVAEEVREILARLGLRSLDEAVGRADLLRSRVPQDHWKARTLNIDAILHLPEVPESVARRHLTTQDHGLEAHIDHQLIELARPALERGEPVTAELEIQNVHRTVGTMLSGEIAKRYGHAGLPDGTVRLTFHGSAGQSFGAFGAKGLTLRLEGEANDYVGKGLCGARLVVVPPHRSNFAPEETILIGNVVLYGATGGEAFFNGMAGERFAVRNSGAVAVVEGVGDHGCEYMTGGLVVVLGKSGRNFAAGMSGGVAYVYDEDGEFQNRCNLGMVSLGPIDDELARQRVYDLIARHVKYTGSARAAYLLENWEEVLPRFVEVFPNDYRRVLEQRRAQIERVKRHVPQQELVVHG